KDSIGQLLPSGRDVLYQDALSDLDGDILYQNRIDGLEQLVILRQQIPSPKEWGLSEDSTFFQVISEFDNPPEPMITRHVVGGVIDEQLDFGIMQMPKGAAFAIGAE